MMFIHFHVAFQCFRAQVGFGSGGTLFEDYIMPLTKEVEVAYLLARLEEPQRQVSVQEETDVDWISPHMEASSWL